MSQSPPSGSHRGKCSLLLADSLLPPSGTTTVLSTLSDVKEIWNGFAGKGDAEGPHIYRKDDYHSLPTAEAGTFEQHLVAIARSKDIWGSYKSYDKNPLLTAYKKDELVQNTEHADLFKDTSDSWLEFCLGVRNIDNRYPIGRETFLTLVAWHVDGWPQIEQPKVHFERNLGKAAFPGSSKFLQHSVPLGIEDIYIRHLTLENYKMYPDHRKISLFLTHATVSSPSSTTTFLGQRQRSFECTATTTLHLDDSLADSSGLVSGLTVYKDYFRYNEIHPCHGTSEVCLSPRNIQNDERERIVARENVRKDLKKKGLVQDPGNEQRNISFRMVLNKHWTETSRTGYCWEKFTLWR